MEIWNQARGMCLAAQEQYRQTGYLSYLQLRPCLALAIAAFLFICNNYYPIMNTLYKI